MIACIGEPISWPRLERHASGAHDAAIAAHVAACAACKQCLDEIERDVVALPVLVVPAIKRRRWIWLALPALAAAAALVLVLRPERPENIIDVKGVGEVTLGVVRERGGAISPTPTTSSSSLTRATGAAAVPSRSSRRARVPRSRMTLRQRFVIAR